MAAQYHFLSEYELRADPERVWAAIGDVAAWPRWWSWVKRVEPLRAPVDASGLGAIYRYTVRAPAGYGFVYSTEATEVEPGHRIDVDSSGEIVGRGRLVLRERPDGRVYLAFAWLVETPKRWMSLLAPIARPMFSWNHDRMMDAFGEGIARVTGGELLEIRNTTIPPGDPGFYRMPALEG